MVNLLRLVVLVAALLAGVSNVMAGDDAFNPCGPPGCPLKTGC